MKTFRFYFVQKDVTWFEQSMVGGPFNKRLVKTAQSGHIEKKDCISKAQKGSVNSYQMNQITHCALYIILM